MKIIARILTLLAMMASAQAVTQVAFTANLSSFTGSPADAFVRLSIHGCGNQTAQVLGVAVFGSDHQDLPANGSGNISVNIYKNSDMTCAGGTPQYWVEVWDGYSKPIAMRKRISGAGYTINAAFNLNTATPDLTPPLEGLPSALRLNPTTNQTITQPFGTTLSIIGNVNLSGATMTACPTCVTTNTTQTITGTKTFSSSSNTFQGSLYAAQVGIGTILPVSPLDIKYADNTQAIWLRRASNNNPTHKMESDASGNGSMDIAADGAAKVHLTSSGSSWLVGGRLGIGVGTPSLTLHVRHDTSGSGYGGVALFESNLGDEQIGIITNSSGVATLGTLTAHTFGLFANGIEGLRLNGGNASVQFMVGVVPNGGGFKHARVTSCTTAASAGAACGTNVTWGTAFVDAVYTVTCSIEQSGNALFITNLSSKGAGSVTVVTENAPGSAASASGTINCIAVHD